MGNRCVITTRKDFDNDGIGVYLHWNGGRSSVEAFLKYCELKKHRDLTEDAPYGYARLCQVIGNFFGGGSSVGVGKVRMLDCNNYDNGTYIVENWKVVGREYFEEGWAEQMDYDLVEMLIAIDEKQPEEEQIGEEAIREAIKEGKHD